jgi:hypothetical protein
MKKNGYGVIGGEEWKERCCDRLSRAVLALTLAGWVLLPLAYVALFAFQTPAGAAPPARVQPAPVIMDSHPSPTVLSTQTCEELRAKHGGGWRPLSGDGKVCSEIQRLPGGGGCPPAKVWIYANKLCAKAGARLCTSGELMSGAGAALDCVGASNEPIVKAVWSSTRCGLGGSYLIQNSDGTVGARASNMTRPSSGGVANCDLSSSKHLMVCCADDRLADKSPHHI